MMTAKKNKNFFKWYIQWQKKRKENNLSTKLPLYVKYAFDGCEEHCGFDLASAPPKVQDYLFLDALEKEHLGEEEVKKSVATLLTAIADKRIQIL